MDLRTKFAESLGRMDLPGFALSRQNIAALYDEYAQGGKDRAATIALGLQLAALDSVGLLRFGERYAAYIPKTELAHAS